MKNSIEGAPALVTDTVFGLEDAKRNLSLLTKLKADNPKFIANIRLGDGTSAGLYITGDGQNGSVFMEYQKRLGLYIKYTTYHFGFLPVKTLTQTKLWRNPELPVTNTFSQRLFFTYMMKITGAVLSDAEHTESGREFWKRRLREALQKHKRVALVDFGSKSFEEIRSPKRLEELFTTAWSYAQLKSARYKQLRWLCWS